MAEKPDDGGPAFPLFLPDKPKGGFVFGMSLRDYFAGQALVGYMLNGTPNGLANEALCAEWAYKFADAMLRARNG